MSNFKIIYTNNFKTYKAQISQPYKYIQTRQKKKNWLKDKKIILLA